VTRGSTVVVDPLCVFGPGRHYPVRVAISDRVTSRNQLSSKARDAGRVRAVGLEMPSSSLVSRLSSAWGNLLRAFGWL